MSSNNPFAFALNEPNSYVHHRDPPPPPTQQNNVPLSQMRSASNNSERNYPGDDSTNNLNFNPNFDINYNQRPKATKSVPPPRPPKVDMPPPSYEEVAPKNFDYPEEKPERHRSSSNPSRENREPNRERSHNERSDRSREHRHRERRSQSESDNHKRRERTSKSSKDKKSPKKDVKPVKAKNLDTIDKLDVTGFFGGGFHHDGPFDACTPHRNKNAKQPPVMAFPVDGPNNTISGIQNVDTNQQLNLAFGTYNEDDQNEIVGRRISKDNGTTPLIKTGHEANEFDAPQQNPGVMAFDANGKATPVHGSTTAGLGSTTFIDGAPAPVRHGSVSEETPGPGLGRKKSLVQRLRKTSSSEENSRRNSNDGTMYGENGRRGSIKDEEPSGNSFIRRVKSLKVRR